jgi:4-amino-4-deoxy-L-arabinose transferase-like glycosyltransferase
MRTPHPGRRHTADLALFLMLAAATLLAGFALRYPSLFEPRWYGDEGIFAAVAQNMREGRTLYSQAWDNKPPLIYFTYAAVQSLFGTGMFALHLVTTIAVLATQVCVIALAALLYGRKRALVAGLVFAFVMDTPLIEGDVAMTETFMILPATLAVLAFVVAERRNEDRRFVLYLAAGLLTGIAAGYKQVAVFDFAAIALMIWLTHERPMRALAPLTVGFAAPQVVLAGVFVADGAFSQYWYAVAGSLGLYANLAPEQNPFVRFYGFLPALMVLAWLVRRRQLAEAVTPGMFPALWLSFAVAGATSSTFAFPHYLQQAAAPFALALVSNPLQVERERLSRTLLGVTTLLIAAVVGGQFTLAFRQRRQLDPVNYYRTFASHRWGTMSDLEYEYYFDGKAVAVDDIVRYMKADGAGTSLYTWSELPWLYAAGGFTNPTRYYTSFLGEVVPDAKPEILRDLNRHPPVYVLVSDDTYAPFEELSGFLAGRYSLIHEQGDWRLYRLTSARGRLSPESGRAPTGHPEAGLPSR